MPKSTKVRLQLRKAAILPKSTKVRLHGNNVHDVTIVHVISADAQINRHGNGKVILGPAGRALLVRPAGKNKKWRKVLMGNAHTVSKL